MNEPKPGSAREPQPWHEADEKKPAARKGGAPIGTHSLTGSGAAVGMPTPTQGEKAERSESRDTWEEKPGAEEPVPAAEPRASVGEILGRKP